MWNWLPSWLRPTDTPADRPLLSQTPPEQRPESPADYHTATVSEKHRGSVPPSPPPTPPRPTSPRPVPPAQPPGLGRPLILGIDLGTTHSVVAVCQDGRVTVIPNQEGERLTPSVVAFTGDDWLIGSPARRQAVLNPARTVASVKRLMGLRRGEATSQEALVPYKLVGGKDDPVNIQVDETYQTPPVVAAMILRKLKEAAEAFLGQQVRRAVITVPAYFSDAQRQATVDAAQIAGFDAEWEVDDPKTGKQWKQRMRIINEPTAASLAYGLDRRRNEKIAVLHLGGGTFDISILDLGDGVFEVKAVNGDTHLGGDDFDHALTLHLANEFRRIHGIDLRSDPVAFERLKEAAERTKKDLSEWTTAEVHLPYLAVSAGAPLDLRATVTRGRFEQLIEPMIERCRGCVLQALGDAGYKPGEIDEVVLVGGMTRVPRVQQLVREVFGKEGRKGINPDEVVAVGAAIQGAQLLLGSASELLLLDVTPLSLGVETDGGRMTKVIERNTTIPKKSVLGFTTTDDNQTSVVVRVFQGEAEATAQNRLLGELTLDGIAPGPKGEAKLEAVFDLDQNGILVVTVKDLKSGREQVAQIKGHSGLSRAEVGLRRAEAEMRAREEAGLRALASARNEAEGAIWRAEELLREHSDRLDIRDQETLRLLGGRLKECAGGTDVREIEERTAELREVCRVITQYLSLAAAGRKTAGDAESLQ